MEDNCIPPEVDSLTQDLDKFMSQMNINSNNCSMIPGMQPHSLTNKLHSIALEFNSNVSNMDDMIKNEDCISTDTLIFTLLAKGQDIGREGFAELNPLVKAFIDEDKLYSEGSFNLRRSKCWSLWCNRAELYDFLCYCAYIHPKQLLRSIEERISEGKVSLVEENIYRNHANFRLEFKRITEYDCKGMEDFRFIIVRRLISPGAVFLVALLLKYMDMFQGDITLNTFLSRFNYMF